MVVKISACLPTDKGAKKFVRNIRVRSEKEILRLKAQQAKKILRDADPRVAQDRARRSAEAALKVLEEVMNSAESSDQARISAANIILERGYGKPTQTNLNMSADADGTPREIDGAELDRRIVDTLERIERDTTRKREKIESEDRPVNLRELN